MDQPTRGVTPMTCPRCGTSRLRSECVAQDLRVGRCPACGGLWIAAADYWMWRRHANPDVHSPPNAASPLPPPDSDTGKAKICPGCGHLLLPYPVAADLPFTLDHCGHCNGVWCDPGEWEALHVRHLHDQLHHFFTEVHQRHLRELDAARQREAWYLQQFGAADYAEIRRVKTWLTGQPARDRLLAYLLHPDPPAATAAHVVTSAATGEERL